MISSLIKTAALSTVILIGAANFSFAQNAVKTDSQSVKKQTEMKNNDSANTGMRMNMNSGNMKMNNKTGKEEKTEAINLKSIDKNKDEMIYQCPMDFDVLSDKPGIDPKCGMKLKKVSLKKAKENLIKHGFKVED